MYISRLASKDIKLGAAAAFKQDTFLDINRHTHTHTYLGTQKLFTLMTKLNAIKFLLLATHNLAQLLALTQAKNKPKKIMKKKEKKIPNGVGDM